MKNMPCRLFQTFILNFPVYTKVNCSLKCPRFTALPIIPFPPQSRTHSYQIFYQEKRKPRSFHTAITARFQEKSDIRKNEAEQFSPRTAMARPKTRQPVNHHLLRSDQGNLICVTYSTADHYKFASLTRHIAQDKRLRHINLPLDITNAIIFRTLDRSMSKADDGGYIIFFREGAISFWNINESTIKETLLLTEKYEIEPYSQQLAKWESEHMDYKIIAEPTRFDKNCFILSDSSNDEAICSEIYAFSNALVMSVKLAHWEHSLDSLIQSIESMPRALIKGSFLRYQTPKMVLQKIGEIFMMRHKLNLQYNMLDVPDAYWDRENLEQLYVATTEFLNITRRVKIMNEKLSYCAHMMELVKSHMAEQKTMRIEILIVLLILIEVIFEFMHFYVKPYFMGTESEES